MDKDHVLGLDIGGTGVKAAIINTQTGELVTERIKILTPQPSTPEAITTVVKQIISQLNWSGLIGCGFPALVKNGVVQTASNIDETWILINVETLFSTALNMPTFALNDADAAGITEMKFGAGKDQKGTVLLLTLGTGIGSALFVNGELIPNTEFGHLIFRGDIAEKYCSNSVREKNDLSFQKWGKRLNKYLCHLERIIALDLIILGGGVSNKFEQFEKYIKTEGTVVPAKTKNEAGVIGAAVAAKSIQEKLQN